jgi:hypothetical protein
LDSGAGAEHQGAVRIEAYLCCVAGLQLDVV